ncbi:hypothetical protein K488DRAFT_84765 [Vararia minispora EC-137]|uniref:Uncharacterized protein n=1 Tax=Vararia minispora EC-137 TaxID=1314806 RepID=A0ACB8QPF7_9AGAM|nr:hypothetical protein K488DRAFT_84765 [Vararia minispora EC-137]
MSSILDLPADVLLAVRDNLSCVSLFDPDPAVSLASHLALSRTCRQLRSLYAFYSLDAEDAFWKDACAAAGFGRPLLREAAGDEPLLTWREVAVIVSVHQGVCEIRSCKESSAWLGPHRANTGSQKRPPVAFHPLFYYLHFCPRNQSLDTASILFTQLPTVPGGRLQAYAPLAGHARASCAFATSPPVRSISLVRSNAADADEEDVVASVYNPDGCTLLDVNRLLSDTLPRTAEHANTVMAHYHTLIESYRAPDRSFAQTLQSGHHRGFLRDHSYPYLDDAPLPEDALDAAKPEVPAEPELALRCSNGPRSLARAGFFVRDDSNAP